MELTSLPSSSPSLKLVIAINMRGCSPCCCLLAMPIKIKTQWIPVNTYPLSILGRIGDYRGWLRQGCRKRGEMPSNALVLFVCFCFCFLKFRTLFSIFPPPLKSGPHTRSPLEVKTHVSCCPHAHMWWSCLERGLDLYRGNEQWVPKSHLSSLQPRIDMCVREIFQRKNASSMCS